MLTTLTSTDFHFPGQKSVYHGKVRDVYDIDDSVLVMVATDRISAFDVVLPKGIPYKGQVLNQIAAYFLDATAHVVPNWKLATPDPMVTVGTKADAGHDENISREEIIAQGIVSAEDYAVMEEYTYKLFEIGSKMAADKGLILVDTKYEFGKVAGKVILIDEIHTPDSSRYFYAEGYEERMAAGEPQRQLSKEFVRQWLIENGFMGRPGQQVPEMTDEICRSISERYIELYEHVTGSRFVPAPESDLDRRIETNVLDCLTNIER